MQVKDRATLLVVLGGGKDGQDKGRIAYLNKLIKTHSGKVNAVRYLIDKDMGK